jgi:outer membrane protein assembly factor BamB
MGPMNAKFLLRYSFQFAVLLTLASLVQPLEGADVWPQFRGPGGQGHSTTTGLPLHWGEQENICWKSPLPGRGWSSPVVADGSVWLTTAVESAASESQRQARVAGRPMALELEVAQSITLLALEVDLTSGRVMRNIELGQVKSPQAIHTLNSYASPTPVLENGRLYCHFGAFGTACVDASSGRVVWHKTISLDHKVGPGSSPVLYQQLLILTCDGADQQYILALNKSTGDTVWRTDRPPLRTDVGDYKKSFSTPLVIRVAGQDQLVVPGAQWFVAYHPTTGQEIWRFDHGNGFSLAPRPVYDGNRLFLCTGYMRKQLWAVHPDGLGDISGDEHTAWKETKRQMPTMASPLLVDDRLLIINDQGIAISFDTVTGKQLWRKRIAGKYSASPLLANGRIYLCNQAGRTTVLADDDFHVMAENDLDGQIMASLAVLGDGDLLLRTDTHLYRIEEPNP